jgi:hypothetical protein
MSTYQTAAPLGHVSLNQSARVWGELVHNLQRGDLSYDLPYQRGDVWTEGQRIMLVNSVLTGTPIPALIINRRPRSMWFAKDGSQLPIDAVIDGKQRLITMRMFMEGELAVPASWFAAEEVTVTEDTPDGPYVRWDGLSRPRQRFFDMSATVAVAEGSLNTVREEAAIYLRVNGSGTMQTDEDMDRAARIASSEA